MQLDVEATLKNIFESQFQLMHVNWKQLAQHTQLISCSRNTCIREAEQVERNMSFLLSGATGAFMYKKDKLVCLDICIEEEFFGDYASIISSQESPMEIRSLTACQYLSFPFSKLLETYQQLPPIEAERIGRQSAEYLFIAKQHELIDSKVCSASERYLKLLQKNPTIFQQIPLKYIASYLGITAESLSRIRKTVTQTDFLP